MVKPLSDRVLESERRQRVSLRRLQILSAFVLFSFLLLAWRSEINADNNRQLGNELRETQEASCARGIIIIAKFNDLQDQLSLIEETMATGPEEVRRARIQAYETARILPLPECPP